MTRPVIVGITGASGAAYALTLIEALERARRPVDLVVSPLGVRLLHEEAGIAPAGLVSKTTRLHPIQDLGAVIASGSYRTAGMVVVPATTGTCGRIAAGTSDNLLVRAADVTLKEKRPLIVVVRETPLSLIHLRALSALAEAGATIMPASPGFYHGPQTIQDLVDFMADRILQHLGVEFEHPVRYPAPRAKSTAGDKRPAARGGRH
jgi:4-hydroxy-3-polyprenylbenzoate decarboxylase